MYFQLCETYKPLEKEYQTLLQREITVTVIAWTNLVKREKHGWDTVRMTSMSQQVQTKASENLLSDN